MRILFFGMGYSARATAEALAVTEPEIEIVGTSRDPENGDAGKYRLLRFDGASADPALDTYLGSASHLVVSIPPGEDGDPVLGRYRDALAASKNLEWICYYSTVGVYGDFDGAWIDESAPCHPVNPRSRHRLLAEQQWQAFAAARGVPLLILRLSGIYGPQRSTFDRLRDGTARRIVKPGQVFNRIHVADIARVTALAATRGLAGTFNLADDEPAPPQDLIVHAAALAGIEPPPAIAFEDAELSPMARSFYADNKRISNAAIKRALGIRLLFPTYREGLGDIARQPCG